MLSFQAQHKKHGLYVDNGFSKNTIGDKDRFLTLNKECYGSVSFGNDNLTKMIGRGTINLGNKDTRVENFLLLEDMKHNLIKMRDKEISIRKVGGYSCNKSKKHICTKRNWKRKMLPRKI
jgi:hypothetical protein